MTIFAVHENTTTLKKISKILSESKPNDEILIFDSSLSALASARKTEVDTAFISVEMSELNGIDLGRYLKDLYPMINLVFISDTADQGYEAISMHASGYLLAPAEKKDIQKELDDLRYPAIQKNHKRLFAQTFGNFELFVDGQPVNFKYSRTKEIVAILINNQGAQTTNGEIIADLWEDDGDPEKKASYLSNLRQDLQNTFNRLKLNGIILKQRGSMAIAKDKIECDLYEWLDKKKESKYQYLGDYMNQYSWPEARHAQLDDISWAMEDE